VGYADRIDGEAWCRSSSGTNAAFENSGFISADEIDVGFRANDDQVAAPPREFYCENQAVIILKFIGFFVLAAALVVALIIAAIFVQQGLQLLRFRASMRSFAKDDARDDDPALEVPEEKGTLEEERERLAAVYALFYRSGLSIAKLHASRRLREKQVFVRPEWIEAQEWRGWQKLATRGSKAAQAKSKDYARREAERRLANLDVRDLPLWLELYEEDKHPELKLRWASRNLEPIANPAALAMLDELGRRYDAIGAKTLYQAFLHFATAKKRTEALKWAERYLRHPEQTHEDVVRSKLREIFAPDLNTPAEYPKFWSVSGDRDARIVVRVHALEVEADDKTWLEWPRMPLNQAKLGAVLW